MNQCTNTTVLETLHQWSEAQWLRRIDSAMAGFVAECDPDAAPALLVAVAVLAHMEGRGHTCLNLIPLVSDPNGLLAWPVDAQQAVNGLWSMLPHSLTDWLAALRTSPVVHLVGRNTDTKTDTGQMLVLLDDAQEPRFYLRRYWNYECLVAQQFLQRAAQARAVDENAAAHWLERLFPDAPDASPDGVNWQKMACAIALRGGLSVITGGPGTGKTYTAARLLALLFALEPQPELLRVALAAPTGKAAARLKQSIDSSLAELHARLGQQPDLPTLMQRIGAARTLHALLGARPDTRQFRFHASQPLDVDVLIVDEVSMVHLEMMAALLDALPPHARVIFLGDKDQLASVEAGSVLGDICRDAERGPLPCRHRRLHRPGDAANAARHLPGTARRPSCAGTANRHAARKPPLWWPDWATGAGRQPGRCRRGIAAPGR